MDRRTFLRLSGAGLALPVLGACDGDKPKPEPSPLVNPTESPGTLLQDVGAGAAQGLAVGLAQEETLVGDKRLLFGLRDPDGSALTEASVKVYAGTDAMQPPVMTGTATYLRDGVDALGLYLSDFSFPTAREWLVAVVAQAKDGARFKSGFVVTVIADSAAPVRGERPPAAVTPTTAKPGTASPLCSSPQNCGMHDLSLDGALKNGKPTVVTFAAPGFCTSQTCGPVVDVVRSFRAEHGAAVNFIHVEAYEKDKTRLAPALVPWKFSSEPWTYFIDAQGIVSDRLSGAVGGEEVRARIAVLRGAAS